jgi:hypothetical protein
MRPTQSERINNIFKLYDMKSHCQALEAEESARLLLCEESSLGALIPVLRLRLAQRLTQCLSQPLTQSSAQSFPQTEYRFVRYSHAPMHYISK